MPLPPVLPVTLSGPDVNETRSGTLTLATGQISFSDLRAGTYLLQVGSLSSLLAGLPHQVAAVLQDYEYGGPAEGYTVEITAGQAATQAVPIDITHTTAHFVVTLRHGETPGMPVPGATVTLQSGENTVGSGETGETGLAMIRFARAGTSGNMVNAAVAVDGYHVADGMTPVPWDPKSPHTQGTNANDIVNLNVDLTVSGATVATDAGWAISVMQGEDAVEGAPDKLDDEGNASFTTEVGADALPGTFAIALADDQDDKLDGGENYGAQAVEYTHTGLLLAGTQNAGALEAAFTTQTLKASATSTTADALVPSRPRTASAPRPPIVMAVSGSSPTCRPTVTSSSRRKRPSRPTRASCCSRTAMPAGSTTTNSRPTGTWARTA